jgi:hypothetical protein
MKTLPGAGSGRHVAQLYGPLASRLNLMRLSEYSREMFYDCLSRPISQAQANGCWTRRLASEWFLCFRLIFLSFRSRLDMDTLVGHVILVNLARVVSHMAVAI